MFLVVDMYNMLRPTCTTEARPALKPLNTNTDVTHTDFDTANNLEIVSSDTCKTCMHVCISEPVRVRDLSVECSRCECWYHLHCAGLT